MYYSDDKYTLIPVPKDKQADIHLRVYNGESFVLSEEKQLELKKQNIFESLSRLEQLILKNNTRYRHHDNWAEYNEKYVAEIKDLEVQLAELNNG